MPARLFLSRGLPLLLLTPLTIGMQDSISALEFPTGEEHVNSVGMRFVRVEPDTYHRGQQGELPPEVLPLFRGRGRHDYLSHGNFDEHPVHEVTITKPFYVGVFEVTNREYELFAPGHRTRKRTDRLSLLDGEAATHLSWYDAAAFCRWLADKEELPYRLPTEAEWEYACRAGSTSAYTFGDVLPDEFLETARNHGSPTDVSLLVGQRVANAWGIHDMHGNVEEWCQDWYGPYVRGPQQDPVGRASGDHRVLRGGSANTPAFFLRSANRLGTLPEDRHGLMGFRVVLGSLPQTSPLPLAPLELHQRGVVERERAQIVSGPDRDTPYFRPPRKYVRIPTSAAGPVYALHNHDPAIVECPNGDLLAVWYTCASETNRELSQAASRLRWGTEEWEPAAPFWNTPDRNDHAPALWFDGKETIYHFSGLAFAGGHYHNALLVRTSRDSGASWSAARFIVPDYARHGGMPSEPVIRLQDDTLALVVDANGSALWLSQDEGRTWENPGGRIRGIHAGLVELTDGRFLAFGRGEGGKLPMSVSTDRGKTYSYADSQFPPVGGGQRLVLLRLQEGPILLASFADTGISITDASGARREIHGLYAAVSLDDGETWPYIRPLSDDGPGRAVECTGGGIFTMSARHAEHRGYLAGCQSADRLIHLISSRQHYTFNARWLMSPAPPIEHPPFPVTATRDTFTGPRFDAPGWVDYKGYEGSFNGRGQYTIRSLTHHNGINRIVGRGSFELALSISAIDFHPRGERISEGVSVGLKDGRARSVSVVVREDELRFNFRDLETTAPIAMKTVDLTVPYDSPPKAVQIRLVWSEPKRRLHVYYGLDGHDATTELRQSQKGIVFGRPLSESTAFHVLVSNGTIELDHFELRTHDKGAQQRS